MKSQYIGAASYARSVVVPAGFAAAGRSVWLRVEHVHRSAKVMAGGALVGEHYGYLSPFEGDVTKHIVGGKLEMTIVVSCCFVLLLLLSLLLLLPLLVLTSVVSR